MMTETRQSNDMGSLSIRYRAICEDCSYRGRWKKDIDDAYDDADRHNAKPGKEDHIVDIITEQTVRLRYTSRVS